jgi:hypothetical protein
MITDINSSKYPLSYDDDVSLSYLVPGQSDISSTHINQLRSAIFATQKTLGLNPGAGRTVAQRLDQLSSDFENIFNGSLSHSLIFGYDSQQYSSKAIFGTNCEAFITYDGFRKNRSLAPLTGDFFKCFECETDTTEVVPLSIVGVASASGTNKHFRIKLFDDVEVTGSLRVIDKLVGTWGLLKKGNFTYDGYGQCSNDLTDSELTIAEWTDKEIAIIGDPRWVNTSGDCMTGDLAMSFSIPDGYGGGEYGSLYPAAITFGACSLPSAMIMCDLYGMRSLPEINTFKLFVHEPITISDTTPLLIYGSPAIEPGIEPILHRRIKLIDDVEVVGSTRVGQFIYAGNNDEINAAPEFDPSKAKVYNQYIDYPSASKFKSNFSSGFVGPGVTVGHRPGHTHSTQDILDLALLLQGPKILLIYDTYDTAGDPPLGPTAKSDGLPGRAVCRPDGGADDVYSKNMILRATSLPFIDGEPLPQIIIHGQNTNVEKAIDPTSAWTLSTGETELKFDIPNTTPVDDYDVTVIGTNGLMGRSIHRAEKGGIEVVAPLTATLSGDTTGFTDIGAIFSVSVSGGKQPYAYHWIFGDGTGENGGDSVTHYYDTAGDYVVTVTVTDFNGFVTMQTHVITILLNCRVYVGYTI